MRYQKYINQKLNDKLEHEHINMINGHNIYDSWWKAVNNTFNHNIYDLHFPPP